MLQCTDEDEKEYKMELSASTETELPLQLMKVTVLTESSILYYFSLSSVHSRDV
jgi:hypothetical protein